MSSKVARVDQFTLKGAGGVEVDIINYGVAVRDWRVPVKGGVRQVVLGFDEFPAYASHSPHLGSLAGRVANRIGGASFELEGKTYKLPANEGGHMLHGGPEGLGRIVWSAEPDAAKNAVRFTHRSPDGAMGFPGNVEFTAVYSLRASTLRLDIVARTDKTTPINVVQHQYFNLGTDRHRARPPLPARVQRLHRDRRRPDPDRCDRAGRRTRSTISRPNARCATGRESPFATTSTSSSIRAAISEIRLRRCSRPSAISR